MGQGEGEEARRGSGPQLLYPWPSLRPLVVVGGASGEKWAELDCPGPLPPRLTPLCSLK